MEEAGTSKDDTWVEFELEENEESTTATTLEGEETVAASEGAYVVGKKTEAADAKSTPIGEADAETKEGFRYCKTCDQPHGEPTK